MGEIKIPVPDILPANGGRKYKGFNLTLILIVLLNALIEFLKQSGAQVSPETQAWINKGVLGGYGAFVVGNSAEHFANKNGNGNNVKLTEEVKT
jgi:hypothetical protein